MISLLFCIAQWLSHLLSDDKLNCWPNCKWMFIQQPHITTNSIQLNPSSKANSSSTSQEIPRILWNTKVHRRVHKIRPPVRILSQINIIHVLSYDFFNIHVNILIPSTPRSSKFTLSLRFPHQNPSCTSPFPVQCHMPLPPRSVFIFFVDNSIITNTLTDLLCNKTPPPTDLPMQMTTYYSNYVIKTVQHSTIYFFILAHYNIMNARSTAACFGPAEPSLGTCRYRQNTDR
jgi:hypothetical protein